MDGKVYFRENDRDDPCRCVSVTAESRVKGLGANPGLCAEAHRLSDRGLSRGSHTHRAGKPKPTVRQPTPQQYGLINSRGNYLAFASDESYFLLCSLEVLDDEGNFKRKGGRDGDMFTKRTIKPHREITSVETASEALALSIGEKARVDTLR